MANNTNYNHYINVGKRLDNPSNCVGLKRGYNVPKN